MSFLYRRRARIVTRMSCLVVAFAALASAGARTAAAQAPFVDDLDSRHRFGVQLGGSAFFQLVYRLRLVGHSYLELGGAAAPEATMNASAGLVVARSTGTRVFPYVAAGVGFANGAGPAPTDDATKQTCEKAASASACPWQGDGLGYGYVRAGAGLLLTPHGSLNLDVGTWVGEKWHSFDDGRGSTTSSSKRIVWPMVGLAYLYSR